MDRLDVPSFEGFRRGRPVPGQARFRLYLQHAAVLAVRNRRRMADRLGPAVSLPRLSPASQNAHYDRVVEPRPAGRAPDRIYLSLRPRDPEGRRIADYREDLGGLAAARGHVERAILARRDRKIVEIEK